MRPLIAERSPPHMLSRQGPSARPAAPAPDPRPAPQGAAPLAAPAMPPRPAEPPRRDARRDPAPSIWAYRAQRLWLTPHFRRFVRFGLPAVVVVLGLGLYFASDANRAAFGESLLALREGVENRPEFRVNVMGIEGASDAVMADIRAALALDLPVSSFDLDLAALRARIEALPAVARAELRIQSGGHLAVRVEERVPALIWQTRDGPVLIDAEGHIVARLADRGLDAPLPVIGGDGADRVVDQALALHAAAQPLADRMRGLAWVGDRRWDVVLDDGRRILLPETGALQALDRVLALHDATDILNRDIVRIDLRDPARLTVQITPAAIDAMNTARQLSRQTLNGEQRG
jgi:cell division protein FtsQ